jgi:HEAT repeat protein
MDQKTLKNMFKDRDKSVRVFCLKTAIRDQVPNLAEFLCEGMRDERPEVVAEAMKGVRLVDDAEVIGMVITYLESPNTFLRSEALMALEGKNHPQVKEAVREFLRREEDATLLASGIKIVGSFAGSEHLPLLRAFLAYEDDRVRANAVEALAGINVPEVNEVLKALVVDRNNRVRANAIKALWDKGIRYGLNTLPEELRSPNAKKRSSVAYILGEIKEERSLDLLIGLLGDISPIVRNRAVLSLGRIGSTRVISHLLSTYAKEDDPKVRDNIIGTCMKINAELTMARLTERFVSEEDSKIRANMIKSLGETKNSKSVLLLAKALKDQDSRVRANGVEAMLELKDPALVELIIPLLNDSHNRVRSTAASSLWKMGGTAAVITLKQMLRSSHKQMRTSAAWALGEIGALQFSDVLQDLTNDSDNDVRKWALKALAKVTKIP